MEKPTSFASPPSMSGETYGHRASCRCCGCVDLVPVIDLGSMPPANRLPQTSEGALGEGRYPLYVTSCRGCGLAQLGFDVAPKELFSDYPYFSSVSKSWLAHAEAFSHACLRNGRIWPDARVVELASNDGYLLQYFKSLACKVLGVDPAESVAAAAHAKGIETVVGFFGEDLAPSVVDAGGPADLLIANNVLAHVPEPVSFLRGVQATLAPAGWFSAEFPSLEHLVLKSEFDTIYHEHYSYLCLTTAKEMGERAGLRLVDVESLETHGGSLRVWFRRSDDASAPHPSPAVDEVLLREASLELTRPDKLSMLQQQARKIAVGLKAFLRDQRESGKRVVGYGAAAKGITLLNFAEIDSADLPVIADLAPSKQGRFVPMAGIPIRSPEEVFSDSVDFVLILPWNLKHEIIRQLKPQPNWGARFVTAVPSLQSEP